MFSLAVNKKRKNLLLVEDEELIAKLETKLLSGYGYTVFHVSSGEEALQFLERNYYSIDLILMDIDLGSGMDGTETAERILQFYNLPILFLSSHTEKEMVEKTEKITSYGYVVKNSGITVLDASIKMALKLFWAYQEISENYYKLQKLKNELEEKEKKLIESEAKFHTAFYYSPAILVISSLDDGKILEVNFAWTEILGYTYEETIGKTFIELGISTPESRAQFLPEIQAQGIIRNRESSVKNKFGELKTFQYCAVVHELNGKKYLFSSAIDVTLEKQIQSKIVEHQREFEQVFENSPNLFFKCTRNGIITKFLAGKKSRLYTSPDVFLGKPISHILPETASLPILEGIKECFQKKQTVNVDYSLVMENETKYFQVSLTPIDTEKAFAVVYDITERKLNELERERLIQFYNFSRKLNEFLIKESSEKIFETLCKIAVEYGRFIFVWIGILKEEKIVPCFFEGKEEGYLSFLKHIEIKSSEDKKGPTAIAFEKGEIIFCNDIEKDPRMEKWRKEALKRGYLSSAAVPFYSKEVSGTLNLYSNKKNTFLEKEIEILKELQSTLEYALQRTTLKP